MLKEKVNQAFKTNFLTQPKLIVRAPGRINLIGEHTDYNNGFVMPAAVDKEIVFAFAKSTNKKSVIYSLDFDEKFEFYLDSIQSLSAGSWQNYVMGVAAEIIKTGRKVGNFQLAFSGNIPKGSGMSSSAALECGTCFGLNELFDLNISKLDMVKISQKAEHNYAGVQCGIMDQFASMMGKVGHAFRLDCRSLEYEYFPIQLNDYTLILFNSNVSHSLANSEYNKRRQECLQGVEILQSNFPTIKSLRDASLEQLSSVKSQMSEVMYRRCKYIIEENERVKYFSFALQENKVGEAAELLKSAQWAMRYEYEITCPEIDFMADFANKHTDVLGARMMGGGFGGCTLNIVKKGSEKQLTASLNKAYKKQFNKEITAILVGIADGVTQVF